LSIIAAKETAMKGCCIWLTGLPCSGKTSLAGEISTELDNNNIKNDILDGDALRKHFSKGLGFSKEDRIENGNRVALLASKIAKHGGIAIVSLVSPYQVMRDNARRMVEAEGGTFFEVFIDTPLEVCKERDSKGMYAKAEAGEIPCFTGVSDPYERPEHPDLVISGENRLGNSVVQVMGLLGSAGCIGIFSETPRALFIGRWQPFHNGHDYIIREKLEEGVPVLIAVRDTPIDEGNPFSVEDRMAMIREAYEGEDVQVISIPDIESVNIGRNVGYAVNEYKVPEDIKGISATQIRAFMDKGMWYEIKKLVPAGVLSFLIRNRG
jgi:adenylyl-sulfate kinase